MSRIFSTTRPAHWAITNPSHLIVETVPLCYFGVVMRIAIIGAGVNGLYLAWKLSQKGHRVRVFEKKGEIGKEACSGLFSARILDFIPEARNLIKHQLGSCFIHFPQKTVKLGFKRPFFIIEHKKLDGLLFSLAEEVGAKIELNAPQEGIPGGFDRTIGCDGALSKIRESLKLIQPKMRLGIQGFSSGEDKSGDFEVWPRKTGGFFWKIPRGQNTEYGALGDINGTKESFENFCSQQKVQLDNIKAALIPQGLIVSRNPRVALCGDAAGLCKPWSGGGVIWGLTAAEILLQYFPDFAAYERNLKKIFYPRIILSKIMTKVVYFLGFNFPAILPERGTIDNDFIF